MSSWIYFEDEWCDAFGPGKKDHTVGPRDTIVADQRFVASQQFDFVIDPKLLAEAKAEAKAEADEKVVVVMIQRCIRRWLSRQMVKQRKIEDTDHVEDEVIKFVPKTVTKK